MGLPWVLWGAEPGLCLAPLCCQCLLPCAQTPPCWVSYWKAKSLSQGSLLCSFPKNPHVRNIFAVIPTSDELCFQEPAIQTDFQGRKLYIYFFSSHCDGSMQQSHLCAVHPLQSVASFSPALLSSQHHLTEKAAGVLLPGSMSRFSAVCQLGRKWWFILPTVGMRGRGERLN